MALLQSIRSGGFGKGKWTFFRKVKWTIFHQYGNVDIYKVPSHEAHLIVMRKELLPRCEAKVYEGDDKRFKLINEQHLLYSNLFNMKEEKDGLGLIMMRDLKFYYPDENDFHYVKLVVDRMERVESELDKIKRL